MKKFGINHTSFGAIMRYVGGDKGIPVAPMHLSGPEATQMEEDLLDPEFVEAVAELGFTARAEKTDGVLRVHCARPLAEATA